MMLVFSFIIFRFFHGASGREEVQVLLVDCIGVELITLDQNGLSVFRGVRRALSHHAWLELEFFHLKSFRWESRAQPLLLSELTSNWLIWSLILPSAVLISCSAFINSNCSLMIWGTPGSGAFLVVISIAICFQSLFCLWEQISLTVGGSVWEWNFGSVLELAACGKCIH